MMRALFSSAAGMRSQQLMLDVTSNNLANVNTTGFKKSRANFEDLMYQTIRGAGAATAAGSQVPIGIEVGMGSRPVSVQRIFLQGDYTETGNDYDMAIQGRGFFQVIRNETEYYTRAGNFTLDSEGFIVTPDGYRLQPEFAVPVNSTVNIDTGGLLVAQDQDGNTVGSIQLTLNDFINPAGLKSVGENLFQVTDASGEPIVKNPGVDGAGTLLQRWLEMSNVDVVQETVNLIVVQRAFEINSQCIKTADQMLGIVNNLR